MKTHISKGGQISIPATVRRRWGTDRIAVEDRGDSLVVRPLPADPVAALIGSLPSRSGLTGEQMRRLARQEEQAAERRKSGDRS
jgi:bifunctional DNA-binding transcriptional regulator/antitoxin component of YhaV-PrlF toxin-antitoxin module